MHRRAPAFRDEVHTRKTHADVIERRLRVSLFETNWSKYVPDQRKSETWTARTNAEN